MNRREHAKAARQRVLRAGELKRLRELARRRGERPGLLRRLWRWVRSLLGY